MSFLGVSVRDGLGVLGSASYSRLARIMYEGLPASPVHLPDFSPLDGAVLQFNPITGAATGINNSLFNNTTKMLTTLGIPVVVYAFKGAKRYIQGFYGLSLVNGANEVIIDGRNRNADIVARGTINVPSPHVITTINFPEVDAPQVFVKFPQFTDIYVGAIGSTFARFSAEQATSFDYFVAGFRKSPILIPPGTVTVSFRDALQRTVFCGLREYPRIRGCYFIGDYAVAGAGGTPLVDFAWQFPPVDVNDYIMVSTCFSAPDTPTIDKSYPLRREGSIYIRRIRYTMQLSNSTALGLITTPDTGSAVFPNFSLIGGLS